MTPLRDRLIASAAIAGALLYIALGIAEALHDAARTSGATASAWSILP